jgi:nucleotide-binding universal stress UspA family protein
MSGKTDLVVMATHGLGPLSRFWLGSVADALVRTAIVPLLLLRLSEQPPSVAIAPPFRHVMIPLDGSDLAEQALEPALQLGRLMEADYTLLRVVKPVVTLDPHLEWPALTGTNETMTRQAIDEAQAYLDRIAERLRGQGLTVKPRPCLIRTQPMPSWKKREKRMSSAWRRMDAASFGGCFWAVWPTRCCAAAPPRCWCVGHGTSRKREAVSSLGRCLSPDEPPEKVVIVSPLPGLAPYGRKITRRFDNPRS